MSNAHTNCPPTPTIKDNEYVPHRNCTATPSCKDKENIEPSKCWSGITNQQDNPILSPGVSPTTPHNAFNKRTYDISPLSDITNFSLRPGKKVKRFKPGTYLLSNNASISNTSPLSQTGISNESCNLPTSTECLTPLPSNIEDIRVSQILFPDEVETQYEHINKIEIGKGYWDINDQTFVCQHCSALMWYNERLHKRYKASQPKFGMCCGQGKVKLPLLQNPPYILEQLFKNNDSHSKHFLKNIRSFNMMFSFTSLGGTIDRGINDGNAPPMFLLGGQNYHRIGSLLPVPGEAPKFSQLYIYDTDNEDINRMNAVSMEKDENGMTSSIITDLKKMLDDFNPYAKVYRMVRDRVNGNQVTNVKLRIIGKRGKDCRTYNLPSTSEVAALIVGDFDLNETDRDVIVETQSNCLKRVSILNPAYLPLQYPLLFPRGEDGYSENIPFNALRNPSIVEKNAVTPGGHQRKTISMREFIAFRLQLRNNESNILLMSQRLFQQFLVDSYTMIESSRLSFIRTHQKQLRADLYNGIAEAIRRGENNPSTLGRRIVLPSSFTGGARYMFQNYQDAMAICRWSGYPDLFITFTCNQKWPEILRAVQKDGLKPEDRPDILCRVFKIKLDQLIKEIREGIIFGQVVSVVYTIEFQKRGLPHAHILVFLHSANKHTTPDDIDKIISAEIPDKLKEPDLFKVVQNLMIHGPCGLHNNKSPCMQNGRCIRHFPKKFVPKTTIDEDGYPMYKRRDNGQQIIKGNSVIDNRFVVPYNKFLLLRYNAHINVEWCNQSRSIKYLFKYVNKGHDRVTATFFEAGSGKNDDNPVDEINLYYDCRYISSCEAAWRIFAFDIHFRDPSVERLSFHLPNQQMVVFDDDDPMDNVLNKPASKVTKFLAWMEANKKYDEARTLTYAQFPTKFVWKQNEHIWSIRKRGFSIGRLHFVPPGSGELYYMRLLLNTAKGCQSYSDIRTIAGITYSSFKDACYAVGLLDDDREYVDAIKEASLWATAYFLRKLFCTLLLANQLSKPEDVWNNTWSCLGDDIVYRQRQVLRQNDLQMSDEDIKNMTLSEIQKILQSNNRSLSEFPSLPQPDLSKVSDCNNRLIIDELRYDRKLLEEEHQLLLSTMTNEQKHIYDKIIDAVNGNGSKLFFLYGYGGTGKTFLWKAISAAIRCKGDIVLNVASSGIAALLLPGGRTAHSRFGIPINIEENSTCNIRQGTPLANLIVKAKLIIWDEAPMAHKFCFEALDKTLRDILRFSNADSLNQPFGGKVVVFGGDFRQILPVIPKGSRQDVIHATINSSYLWKHCEVLKLTKNMRLFNGDVSEHERIELSHFSHWILSIGDGSIGEENDDNIEIDIPNEFLLTHEGDSISCIVEHTYPDFLDNCLKPDFFQNRAILAPTNNIVKHVNDYMLSLMPGEERTFLSFDTPCSQNEHYTRPDDIHTPEFLNTIISSGLPNHEIKLKIGVPIILLRNIDQSAGMCNGTRLVITQMGAYVLEAQVISGTNSGTKVLIPRLSLTPSDNRIPFKFQRRQFPIALSFAMTINKSQGQSLAYVGLYIPKTVFSHGQLYVAISRVTNKKGLKILLTDDEGKTCLKTTNVVYKEVFRNIY